MTLVTVPANSTVVVGDGGTLCRLSILMESGEFADVLLVGAQRTVTSITEINQADWGAAAGSKLYNLYWDATALRFLFQNNTAAPVTAFVGRLGIQGPDPNAAAGTPTVFW